jgi:hypothetical protein
MPGSFGDCGIVGQFLADYRAVRRQYFWKAKALRGLGPP